MGISNSIKNWTEEDRPREKMLIRGVASLSDAELLAILIASGTREFSALDLARQILALAQNNIVELGKLTIPELQKVKGIGEARAITISAALEIGRRRQTKENINRVSIVSSKDAAGILMPYLQDLSTESFYVLYLNHSQKYIKSEKVSDGGISATIADIRIILKKALLYNSNKIIIAHNHPSGSKKPSESDKILTNRIKDAAAIMDIQLVDHIIIVGNEYVSFADEGLI